MDLLNNAIWFKNVKFWNNDISLAQSDLGIKDDTSDCQTLKGQFHEIFHLNFSS
jgi:hypothetical protein